MGFEKQAISLTTERIKLRDTADNMQANSEPPVPPAEANKSRTASDEAVVCKEVLDISERLKTQDNRITQNPMFCVQIKRRDSGYDTSCCDNRCWWNPSRLVCVYDDEPKDLKGWDGPYGYKDRWETVMVAFTEGGCAEYLRLNGHNDRSRAHNGEVRIYVESFNRCPEMIAIREALMSNGRVSDPA